jgi:predicted nucleic acid-binding protein|tara:strand:- start:2810 stop:3004 length:195 start_codon:yes stop_codon:yes gene_type:complete
MVYQEKTWKDDRTQLEILQDKMYRHYLDEKQIYQETDVLSKKEYLEKYKQFLIEKLKEENSHDR